jgi:8-oxo-dGTP diphosphatase
MATSILPVDPPVIKAAGGILQRYTPQGDEVMIVYRKRHQDWTLPKGKVKDGESFQEAAMREVEEETGCSCRVGNYLGTISYADNGVPKVVLFWKMSLIAEKGLTDSDEIGEAVWMQIPAAIQRLTYAQEKALLSRIGSAPKLAQPQLTPPLPQTEPAPLAQLPRQHKNSSAEDNRAYSRLLRESEAFRVELAFLGRRNEDRRSQDRRSERSDNSWSSAAQDQLQNVQRCLESNDIEGGWLCLHAAQRYAVFGLNKTELANRAHILREEAQKAPSWRSGAIASLLAVGDDQLTAERVADAMALRNEDSTNQYYRTRLTGDQLRILLIICGLAAVALMPFMLLSGHVPIVSAAMFFGLIGAAFCSAQSLILGKNESKNESKIPNIFVTLTPVLFGAVAGLAGFAIYEYLAITFNIAQQHVSAILALAFLFGCIGQRVLAQIAGPHKESPRISVLAKE